MRSGFTQLQLDVLRNQILAFRRLKRGEFGFPAHVLAGIKPPTLLRLCERAVAVVPRSGQVAPTPVSQPLVGEKGAEVWLHCPITARGQDVVRVVGQKLGLGSMEAGD
ncbi:hypothetical protein WJX72_003630 [[Myrmecia] bisecta]|uniref:QLQ domain-containing protein n=1 Tax=[Myrmecia] bisecta TaxID=41462 RepID=A0AAW1P4U5_9CHLO